MGKYFGTDGIRGIANVDLTLDLAFKVGDGLAYILKKQNKKPLVLIGKDTRVSCGLLESGLVSALTSSGIDVLSLGVVPTPCVSFLIKHYNADAGIMISASHNSFEYNGIKIFNKDGFKLDDNLENEIENLIDTPIEKEVLINGDIGSVCYDLNSLNKYTDYIKKSVSNKKNKFTIAVDCSNGSSTTTAFDIFDDICERVIYINNDPNGVNINLNCGSTHLDSLRDVVLKNNCDLGVAFDGDADRCLCLDEKGKLIDGDQIMAVLSRYLKNENSLKDDTCVITVMTNMGFHTFCKENDIKTIETKVGDRFVLEEMLKGDFNIGGEQSGHIILRDFMSTGDGQLAALMFLKVLFESGQKASELKGCMSIYPQVLYNIKVNNDKKNMIINDFEIMDIIKKWEDKLKNNGRILVRASGTEPLIRVMVEGVDNDVIKICADEVSSAIKARLI
ncbi:MAG: phosphoglucosamine mutase [Oscillospiraceae bacterium]